MLRRLGYSVGVLCVALGEVFTTYGFKYYARYATQEQILALLNRRMLPLGLEVLRVDDPRVIQDKDQAINKYLSESAKELGGGHTN